MKILLLIFGTLIALPTLCQTPELVEVIRRWPKRVDVNVTDGLVHKRLVSDQSDSAFYFHSNGKKYLATTTFKEIGGIVVPPTDVIEDVDDRDARIKYGLGWDKTCCTSDPNSPHHNSTISFHCTVGGTFTFTFVGKSVTWFAEKLKTHGTVGVKFDTETLEAPIDLYSPTQLTKQAIFTKTWPTVGEHKVIIRITGKNPLAVANCLVSDSFRIIK